MHWKQFWTLTSGRVARISARGVRQVLKETGEGVRRSTMRVRHGNLTRIATSNSGPRPASPISQRTDRTLQRSQSTLRKRSKQPYQPPDPPRGRTQTNPLMAGRRRRTPAAALRWRRCRCRCRSSSRSTCAGIECHSSPRVVFMICCPRDYDCSMAWRFTTALMLRIT